MPCLPISVPLSPNVHSLIPKPRKCSKSWSCNIQCNTMRQGIGSGSKTSPSSPTSPFLLTANCSSLDVSSTRRPRRRDELTSPPLQQQPQQHLLSIPMPYPSIPAVTNVATPTPSKSPAKGHPCYACSGCNHYKALYRQWKKTQQSSCNHRSPRRGDRSPRRAKSHRDTRSKGQGHCSSHSPNRHSCCHFPSCSQFHSTSHSPSCSASPHQSNCSNHQCTPFWYYQDSIKIIAAAPTDSIETVTQPKRFPVN